MYEKEKENKEEKEMELELEKGRTRRGSERKKEGIGNLMQRVVGV